MGKGGCKLTINNPKIQSSISKKNKAITHDELSQKTSIQECWIAYESKVYDVTHWLAKHPGGVLSIMSAAGQDATSVMKSLHHPSTLITMNDEENSSKKTLKPFLDTKEMKARKRSQEIHAEFQTLNQELQSEGWYDAKSYEYIPAILRVAMFAFVGVKLVLLSTESIIWNQISLVIGSTHYVHHSATNSLHDDPDIQHMPLL